jgi:hypothetical protein
MVGRQDDDIDRTDDFVSFCGPTINKIQSREKQEKRERYGRKEEIESECAYVGGTISPFVH